MTKVSRTDTNDEVATTHQWQSLSTADPTFPYIIEVIEAMGGILIRFKDVNGEVQCGIVVEPGND